MQRQGQLTWNASTLDVLYAEPDGGNCRAHCVTDQPLPAAIAAIRAEVAENGLAPPGVVSAHERIAENHSAFGSYEPATKQGEWGLFVGDVGFNLARETMQAALRLLEACELDVVPVGCGLDSGFIPCSLGYPRTAHAQARLCIEEVQRTGIKKLLVLSPQDLFAFLQMHQERLDITWPEDVVIIDLVDFLASQVPNLKMTPSAGTPDNATAYVDPTHAVRLPGRFDAARTLCEVALGYTPLELFWRQDRAHPVGSTAIQFTRPDIGVRLTEARLEDAINRGAQSIVCDDPATLHELRLHNKHNLRVQGLYETLLARLAGHS
jgi:Fe-S oxidoreductase